MLPPSVSYKEIAPPSVLASLSLRTQQRPIPKEEEVEDLFGDLLFMCICYIWFIWNSLQSSEAYWLSDIIDIIIDRSFSSRNVIQKLHTWILEFLSVVFSSNWKQCAMSFNFFTGFYIYGKTWKLHVNKIPKHIIVWPYTPRLWIIWGTWTKAVLSPANLAWLFGRLMCFPIISLLFNVFPYY